MNLIMSLWNKTNQCGASASTALLFSRGWLVYYVVNDIRRPIILFQRWLLHRGCRNEKNEGGAEVEGCMG